MRNLTCDAVSPFAFHSTTLIKGKEFLIKTNLRFLCLLRFSTRPTSILEQIKTKRRSSAYSVKKPSCDREYKRAVVTRAPLSIGSGNLAAKQFKNLKTIFNPAMVEGRRNNLLCLVLLLVATGSNFVAGQFGKSLQFKKKEKPI